ncbi:MAG: hypothetical protein K6E84_02010 [Lachnospiraceae bacterium]|nr:hypothetical protein [Lachnospiraceae bacterium]
MNEKIVICDKEATFVSMLAKNLKRVFLPKQPQVLVFDDGAKMFADKTVWEDSVLLLGDSMLGAFEMEKLTEGAVKIIPLTEQRGREGIFKYQSAGDLSRQILEIILSSDDLIVSASDRVSAKDSAFVMGLYSPARPLIQSRISLTMGQIIAAKKKCLYLNLEPYSGMEYLMQKEFSHDLTDLLFFIRNQENRLPWRLKSLVESVGKLDYIPPVFSYPDLEEMEPDGMCKLIDRIATETDYEVLILDLCEMRGIFTLLKRCDRIICPYQSEGLAEAKVDQYEKMLAFLKEDQLKERLERVKLPAFSHLPREVSRLTESQLAEFVRTQILTEEDS